MTRSAIRWVIIFGTISIIGIIVTQVFWVARAFDLREKEFNHNVNIALKNVVESLCHFNGTDVPSASVIEQMSSNYFIVNVNNMISPEVLEYFLKAELGKRSVNFDFEYGIYDCSDEKMVYGNHVAMSSLATNPIDQAIDRTSFPGLKTNNYYFGVYFPDVKSEFISNMGIWIFSSSVLLAVVVFFTYAMFVILKQKRLSEVQRDFINNMTHEFKTPISTIAVSAEVLQQNDITGQPDRLKNYAGIIQTENNRLKKQVERVLQMAVLDTDKIEIKKEWIDIHEILDNVIKGMEVSLREKSAQIRCITNAAQSVVTGDKLHITNVLYNLVDNAVKYCKEIPEIEIITSNTENGIEITLKDNGIGISEDQCKKIFNRFYRVPTGNIHDVKGFGLGLNYVKTMVTAHHGQISVQSTPGLGSSFKIFLPIE